jgi:hypothetical protein
MVMKGLPLTYSKDMQEDKEGAFDALQNLSLCVAAMTGMVIDITPDLKRMKAAAGSGLRHRHRPCRLAGARAEDAVPRGPPRRQEPRELRRHGAGQCPGAGQGLGQETGERDENALSGPSTAPLVSL